MILSPKAICLIVAVVLFFLAGIWGWARPGENRFNLVAAGLFFYALKDAVS